MSYSIMVIGDGEFKSWTPEVADLAAAKALMKNIATEGYCFEETRTDRLGVEYTVSFYLPPGSIQFCKAIPTGTIE